MSSPLSSAVAVAVLEPNDRASRRQAVGEVCERLGGLAHLVGPSRTVLIKPDLSITGPVALASHLEIVMALGRLLRQRGARVLIGDSPAFLAGSVEVLWERSGLGALARQSSCELVNFERAGARPFAVNTGVYYIARPAVEVDLFVNVARLSRTVTGRLCGTLDNLLGVLPGFYKAAHLCRLTRPRRFDQTLVDLYSVVQPGLSLLQVDTGDNRNFRVRGSDVPSVLLASMDGVALDAVAARLAGINAQSIHAVRIAAEAGLGIGWPEAVGILGELPLQGTVRVPVRALSFELRDALTAALVSLRPVWGSSKCSRCGRCEEWCPTQALRWSPDAEKPAFNEPLCVSCWCCLENCPDQAILIRKSWLADRIAGFGAESAPSKILLDKALPGV